ncbi:MAG: hypothetical protein GXP37_06445 [Chloroflexi bacterium]|nr:hypothetical protein [Chloroflexota bacterium]
MKISEYQDWIRRYDAERGFDQVQVSQILVHALEELGEVAREILYLEGYRQDTAASERRLSLAEELSDTFVFLFQLANHFQIDMEAALRAGQEKAHRRFTVEEGRSLAAQYHERQRQQAKRVLE